MFFTNLNSSTITYYNMSRIEFTEGVKKKIMEHVMDKIRVRGGGYGR